MVNRDSYFRTMEWTTYDFMYTSKCVFVCAVKLPLMGVKKKLTIEAFMKLVLTCIAKPNTLNCKCYKILHTRKTI